jgi:hypothetical protein
MINLSVSFGLSRLSYNGQRILTWSYSIGLLGLRPWLTSIMWSVLSIRNLQNNNKIELIFIWAERVRNFSILYTHYICEGVNNFRFCILGVKIGPKSVTYLWSKFYLLQIFFFCRKSIFFIYNLNTATHAYGGLKNQNFNFLTGFLTGCLDHICARTFQGLHSVRLWTPTIYFRYFTRIW